MKSPFRFIIISLCLLLLSSCDNFLEGADVKAQIEDAIAYNNATSYKIKIDYPESSGVIRSPAGGVVSKKVTDSFNIRFDPSSDYEFICWKIIDSVSKKEYKNGEYLTLEHLDLTETDCHFTKAPAQGMELCLMPVVAERPQIIFNSPVSLNALKDCRIQVLFDSDMDPDSIYYTEAEIDTLSKTGIPDEDFLPPLSETSTNHYGYKKDGEFFFKNISIKNGKTGESLNRCFDAPVFENSRSLVISVKNKDILEDFTQVLVTIEKGFFYTENYASIENGKAVEMAGSKRWMYQVNNKTDTLALTLRIGGQDLFSVKTPDDQDLDLIEYFMLDTDGANLGNLIYINDKKLKLDIQVQEREGGSGPASYFEVYATKVFDSNYEDIRVMDDQTYQWITPVFYENPLNVNYQTVTSDVAIFKGEVDLSSLNLEDGIYQFYCLFYDKSGNVLEYPDYSTTDSWLQYYFGIDNDFSMEEPVITDVSDSEVKFKIDWKPGIDYAKTKIRYKKHEDEEWSEPIIVSREFNTKKITGLELATEYDFEVSCYDFAGNEKEFTVTRDTGNWGLNVSGTPEKTLYFEGDDFDKTGLTVTKVNLIDNTQQVLATADWEVEFDSEDIGINKTVKVKYTRNGLTKYADIDYSYSVAAKDALTEKPVKFDEYNCTYTDTDTDSTSESVIEVSGAHYYFGDFPQTISANQENDFYTTEPVFNGWYLGSDGYFYEKCLENLFPQSTIRVYSDKTSASVLSANSSKYFKVEPIQWFGINTDSENNENVIILISKNILTADIPFYNDKNEDYVRTINGKEIYPNNYKYSTIRAYLNGSYEPDDTQIKAYEDNGFLQKAFTSYAQNLINVSTIDNSLSSSYSYTNQNFYNHEFYCENTEDKVFLLSRLEETAYAEILKNNYNYHVQTDYAKANYSYNTYWWLRSPAASYLVDQIFKAYYGVGNNQEYESVGHRKMGIVPAIVISSDLE